MTLKDLVRVLPAYTRVYVHDRHGNFAHKGNPHQFVSGLYKSHGDDLVCLATPIDSYCMEILVVEVEKRESSDMFSRLLLIFIRAKRT